MVGVPFAERGPMTDEYLAAMRELWTSPSPSFKAGTRGSAGWTRPEPSRTPPAIWAAGAPRLAAPRRRSAPLGN